MKPGRPPTSLGRVLPGVIMVAQGHGGGRSDGLKEGANDPSGTTHAPATFNAGQGAGRLASGLGPPGAAKFHHLSIFYLAINFSYSIAQAGPGRPSEILGGHPTSPVRVSSFAIRKLIGGSQGFS